MSFFTLRKILAQNSLAILLSILLFVALVFQSAMIFMRSKDVMQYQLHERLQTAAALASQQFTGEELDAITAITSLNDSHFRDVVERLQAIRFVTPDIEYAYIMRKTEDPNMLEFIADADSLQTKEEMDVNENGAIEPGEDKSVPGDLYDISDVPAMQGPAFEGATVDEEITEDQWGLLISGYAPIYRSDGTVAGIIGLDMNAAEFIEISSEAYSTYALLTMILISIVIVISILYIVREYRMQSKKVISRERSALLALATHQLGSPISSIRWWLEMIKDKTCNFEEAREHIEEAAEQIGGIVNQLIRVEEQEHGKKKVKREPSNIRLVIQDAIEHAPDTLKEGRSITIDVPDGLMANIDAALTESILAELLENAMTYSAKETPIHVSAQDNGKWVSLSVEDKGSGIAKKEQGRIFQKFTRGENAGKFRPNGSGIGLYVIKLILEQAGGTVRLKSTLGAGSTFTVVLPK